MEEKEEEFLTANIFELLSCDLQMYMLSFLTMSDLYQVSLSCQHGAYLVLSSDADIYVWKLIACQLGLNNEDTIKAYIEELKEKEGIEESFQKGMELRETDCSQDEEPSNVVTTNDGRMATDGLSTLNRCMWRELVWLNMIHWDPDTRTANSDIQMHNQNKTISCEKINQWYTIRASRKLVMGVVHCWEYSLDEHDNGDYNAYRIFVGIERSTFGFVEASLNSIIGFSTAGVSYNIGQHIAHVGKKKNSSILNKKKFKFSTGDTISMKLDLKNLTRSGNASMYLFKNNEYFHTIQGIPTRDILYYPAISVIGRHRVSIRMRHPSMLDNNNVVK